ncbi:hypothetical protein AYK24_06700 [Thermoplasmatales archaeon SG8-52-4]|nr:MAG: hypothetical protein AYK24_06700 [Thermoplasmatales archaeon SG8-52-4]
MAKKKEKKKVAPKKRKTTRTKRTPEQIAEAKAKRAARREKAKTRKARSPKAQPDRLLAMLGSELNVFEKSTAKIAKQVESINKTINSGKVRALGKKATDLKALTSQMDAIATDIAAFIEVVINRK